MKRLAKSATIAALIAGISVISLSFAEAGVGLQGRTYRVEGVGLQGSLHLVSGAGLQGRAPRTEGVGLQGRQMHTERGSETTFGKSHVPTPRGSESAIEHRLLGVMSTLVGFFSIR
jgi:hypothetical protein